MATIHKKIRGDLVRQRLFEIRIVSIRPSLLGRRHLKCFVGPKFKAVYQNRQIGCGLEWPQRQIAG
ncbi:MAG: hypothetical protein CTY16_00600 [Methylobacter sp.]|nr:MAG: hypothetical protein CTY16_00600 [Methylobacter sp.]